MNIRLISVKLALGLLRAVKECIEKVTTVNSDDSKTHLIAEDTSKVAQILEVCTVLLTTSHKDFMKNDEYSAKVCKKIVPLLPKILSHFGNDPICNEALSIIISKLCSVFTVIKGQVMRILDDCSSRYS